MKRLLHEAYGQAMVEFALMLVIIMALCVGMIHVSNLLNYDYWAQQEARYVAFEQTWAAKAYRDFSGADEEGELSDAQWFHRPESVSRLDVDRGVEAQESLSNLLISKRSPWTKTTKEWLESIRDGLSPVQTAFASWGLVGDRTTDHDFDYSERDEFVSEGVSGPVSELERGLVEVLIKGGFGEDFCEVLESKLQTPGVRELFPRAGSKECAAGYNNDFGIYLAEHIDFPSLFRDFGTSMEFGIDTRQAFEGSLEKVVADGFYSFFDTAVSLARGGAQTWMNADKLEQTANALDDSIIRMTTDMRYVGSLIAVGAITSQLSSVITFGSANRSALVEKNMEDSVNSVLHADADTWMWALNPLYLPVPPYFGATLGGLQEGLMQNVLKGGESWMSLFGDSEGDESGLIGPWVEESNKNVAVSYESDKGIFPAARRRFTNRPVLTSRFYLVTQPWHITRRENGGAGNYRTLGEQFDSISEETDEGILRRRVAGLWLFPSAPAALLDPITDIPGLEMLGPFVDTVKTFDDVISTLKNFLFIDNPITKLFDFLGDIPLIGEIVPKIPKWPVVRPALYPDSFGLGTESSEKTDMLTGAARNFADYIKEQKDNNPEPKPEFN